MLDLLLEKLDGAKNYGRYIVAKCPFHKDSRPSFFVYHDAYYCKSCRAYGKTEQLLDKLGNLPARPQLSVSYTQTNPFSGWLRKWNLHQTLEVATYNLPSNYLRERGIPPEAQAELGLGLLDGWNTFPILNRYNELIGAVARVGENNVSDAKYVLPKGQSPRMLYIPSWKRIREHKRVYVTFGILDAATLYLMGLASISTTTGQTANPDSFDDIRKQLIFLPDVGEETSAIRLTTKLDWRGRVHSLNFPPGCKDVNDFFKFDREGLYEVVRNI